MPISVENCGVANFWAVQVQELSDEELDKQEREATLTRAKQVDRPENTRWRVGTAWIKVLREEQERRAMLSLLGD